MVPTGKAEPGACELVNVDTLQLSLGVGAVQVAVQVQPVTTGKVMSAGMPLMVGAILSTTVTVKLWLRILL